MRIEHIAVWVKDLEAMKAFYVKYFNGNPNSRYTNSKKGFSSYFISFENGARLELMHMPSVPDTKNDCYNQFSGIIHIAFSAGSEENVNIITKSLADDGFQILDGPRKTGDGYYESVVLDPENNRIEITV